MNAIKLMVPCRGDDMIRVRVLAQLEIVPLCFGVTLVDCVVRLQASHDVSQMSEEGEAYWRERAKGGAAGGQLGETSLWGGREKSGVYIYVERHFACGEVC